MRRRAILLTCLAAMLSIAGCDSKGGDTATSGEGKTLRIAVVPKGLTHSFWNFVKAGAEQAAAEAGNVEIIWKGPPKEDDTIQQIDLVRGLISSGVDGIVLAPLSDQALVGPVQDASGAGIPVVIIDSGLSATVKKDYVAYVGTDNYVAGTLAGKRMAALIEADKTVMILRYAESSASTAQREQGFIDALKEKHKDIAMIDPPQYAGATKLTAKDAANNMLTAHEGKFDAIYCPNESSTEGMLEALEDRGLAGKTTFVGFDSNERLIGALKDGKIHGLVLQNPINMGKIGVETMLKNLKKQDVPDVIDTGAVMVTRENMDEDEVKRLLRPPTK